MPELTPFPPPREGPVLVVPPAPPWTRAARAAGWRVRRRDLAARPWCQSGTLVVAGAAWSVESIVLALSRGAGVVLDPADRPRCGDRTGPLDPARLAAVLDDARRIGAVVAATGRRPHGAVGPRRGGRTAARRAGPGPAGPAAARETNMSLRTAHRRLRDVRRALGAATTAEAVGRWAQGRLVPAGDGP